MDSRLILHTILALLLLAIPAGALYLLERQKLVKFVATVGRMIVQLLAVCLIVWALIRLNNIWVSLAWLMLISVGSAWLVLKRCGLQMKQLPAVAGGLFLGVLFVGFWLLVLAMPVHATDARWFVPVTGLLMGHSSAMLIRGLNTYVSALKADMQQYEFLRGNGATHLMALKPFARRALLAVISPTIANLQTLGLVAIPLLLCGMLLGGMTPINAFVLMLFMTVGCVAASVLVLGLTLWLVTPKNVKNI